MDDKLFKAILSMDSYNRGYNQGIEGLDGMTTLGNATIINQSDTLQDSQAVSAGFYAVAYAYGNQVTISYRGTDVIPTPWANDVLNGYGVGGGSPTGPQAGMALAFYREVMGTAGNPYTANISLTGHSMGGSLAGLVAATYGKYATIFQNMAYTNVANDNRICQRRVA